MVISLYLCFFMFPTIAAVTDEGFSIHSPKQPTGLLIEINACLETEEL